MIDGACRLKLIDFGLATSSENSLSRLCGTLEFVAPEVFQEKYDNKCDLWAVGVITYMLLTNRSPFFGNSDQHTSELIGNYDYTLNREWEGLSEGAKSFIECLLTRDVSKRWSA